MVSTDASMRSAVSGVISVWPNTSMTRALGNFSRIWRFRWAGLAPAPVMATRSELRSYLSRSGKSRSMFHWVGTSRITMGLSRSMVARTSAGSKWMPSLRMKRSVPDMGPMMRSW